MTYQIYKTENWGSACKWAVSLNGKVLDIFRTKKEAKVFVKSTEKKQSAIFFKKLSTIKCGDCGHIVSKDEALELEYCSECEACLDIPNEWIEELE